MTLKHDLPRQLSRNSQQIDTKIIASLSVSLLWTSIICRVLFGGLIGAILNFIPIVVLIVHMLTS
jgi:hypothetical protein